MIEIIEKLITNGNAYETDDGVYFSVESFPHYGELSGNTLDHISSGARVAVNEQKRHPADFALWKKSVGINAHHVLKWNSPWGEGFPGWHIECSAMSKALLGEQIDIHTGGEDNIFPHHECEIAQSEAASGKSPFVRLWLHKRHIDFGDQKMSKSLGNILTVPDLVAKGYSPQDARYYFLSVHYRTNLKFSWKGMDDAKKARRKIMEFMSAVSSETPKAGKRTQEFTDAMNADLNTPAALAVVFEAINEFKKGDSSAADLKDYAALCLLTSDVFGCFEEEAEEGIPRDVQDLVDERNAAREAKNFAESDRLRDAIDVLGYEVRDTSEGQVVRRK